MGPGPAPTPVLSCPGTGGGGMLTAVTADGSGGDGREVVEARLYDCWLLGRILSAGDADA